MGCTFAYTLLLLLCLQFPCADSAQLRTSTRVADDAHPTVHIPGLGAVRGVYSDHYPGVQRYFGIPFAKPPVGALRWAAPQPYGPFGGLHDATSPGPACIQPDAHAYFDPSSLDRPELGNLTMAEDCLTLNIAVSQSSQTDQTRGSPVMVWIHGGAYLAGSGANYRNDALVNASGGRVVVVTFNYRLGVFGFLGSAELAAQAADRSTGNYGMADQRLVLQWVHQHIGAFGGDPLSISIFGESAGGNSVVTHLVQPKSLPSLYTRAIIQSGTYAGDIRMADAQQTYQTLLRNASCGDLACLLDANAFAIAAAVSGPEKRFGPVRDGVVLRGDPYELLRDGIYNREVPVMLGHNREEMALGLAPPSEWASFSEAQLDSYLSSAALNESSIRRVKQLYSKQNFSYPAKRGNQSFWWWAAAASLSDAGWGLGHCSVRRVARMLVAGGTPAVYAYEFRHAAQGDATDGTYGWSLADYGFSVPGNTASPHGSEIVFAFGAVHAVVPGEAAELATRMGEMWSNFSVVGSPGAGWPGYAHSNDTFLMLDVGSNGGVKVGQGLEVPQCGFFDELLEGERLSRG
eukprot:Hpha_TRINITY_DN16945_c2_g3::TRINITY_DN16945_c2_g3_i1::g.54661::m.54661